MAMQVTLKTGTLFSRFSLDTFSIIKQTPSLPAIRFVRFISYAVLIFHRKNSLQLIQPITEIKERASGSGLLEHIRGKT